MVDGTVYDCSQRTITDGCKPSPATLLEKILHPHLRMFAAEFSCSAARKEMSSWLSIFL
jgi:hypothetical protein